MKIGITGKNGFIGTHLNLHLGLHKEFSVINFVRSSFDDHNKLCEFVSECDVIIHLAALNRHENPEVIYSTNVRLVEQLIAALDATGSTPHVLYSSSLQETSDNPYGASKKLGRSLLGKWAASSGAIFTGLIIPNVFGPFGLPFYNSFIATFCHQLTNQETPIIKQDNLVSLIYVSELVEIIIKEIKNKTGMPEFIVPHTTEICVSAVLEQLLEFKSKYLEFGEIPLLDSKFKIQLFNTFRSYMEIESHFPVKFKKNADERGIFVELLRLHSGGQVSFSVTRPGITRGNHYHTRKIERFAVISGEARIQLRKIGTEEVIDLYLSGEDPAYVDMPVWYTHNITNISQTELVTVFWINEFFDPNDADTFQENV